VPPTRESTGLRLLGPVELVVDGRTVDLGGPRQQVVLCALALNANRLTTVERLVDALWEASPPATARAQIHSSISALRKVLARSGHPDAITTRAGGYLLDVAALGLDIEEFTELVAVAREHAEAGRTAEAAAALRSALGLWRGPALAGLESAVLQQAAAGLEERRRAAAEDLIGLDLAQGRHEELLGELRAMVTEHPLRERLHGLLMLALYRSGRQAEALEAFRAAREVLVEELGIDPGPELQDLHRAILNRDPSLDPPGSAASTPPQLPRQLPAAIGDFTDRDGELAEIRQRLASAVDPTRAGYAVLIIGIFGRGGVGKSTLAVRAAHEAADLFPDGNLYADLQSRDDDRHTAKVLARFLRALGVSGSAVPDDPQERVEMYRSRLAGKRVLVVLDEASGEDQVRPLLPGSPGCAVIVTSRARLSGLAGAYGIDVEGLDPDHCQELLAKIIGSGRLRAEQHAATDLVRFCGGLPLAVRIAGARLASRPHWSIRSLVQRLTDEARQLDELAHRGLELRSSIAITYRTLSAPAQRLFRLFALVRAPDFPAWTAAALLDTSRAEAEELLESLVDVQLLQAVSYSGQRLRYRFHELVRTYAWEQLMEAETEAERHEALARVLGGWLALAEEAHRREYGGDDTVLHGSAPRWRIAADGPADMIGRPMEWLEHERAALIAAVHQAAAAGLDELCWDLALSAVTLFETKGYFDDWWETTQVAAEATERAGNRRGQAAMQYSMGALHLFQKRLEDAEWCFTAALEMFAAVNDVHGRAMVLRNQAFIDGLRGRRAVMLAKYTEALETMRRVGDRTGAAHVLRNLATFRMRDGETALARELLQEALALCQQASAARSEAQVLYRFAELYLLTDEIEPAERALRRVLDIVAELDDRIGRAYAVYGLGTVQHRKGHLDQAERSYLLALDLAKQLGERLIEAQAIHALGEIALAGGRHSTAVAHLHEASRLFDQLGSTIWRARSLIVLAEAHAGQRDTVAAGRVLDAAADLLAQSDSLEAAQWLGRLQAVRSAIS
jgi:DNA-binding SARP family transcriptional activator